MFLPFPPRGRGCRWVLRFSYGTVAGGTDAQFLADKGSSVFLGQTKLQQMSDEIFQNMASIMALAERMAVRFLFKLAICNGFLFKVAMCNCCNG
eukprot:COSAG06_NODE_21626_length_750_cov_1.651306_1_plen_93_part_10